MLKSSYKLKKVWFLAVVLLICPAYVTAQKEKVYSRAIPKAVWGKWEIYRYKKDGGSLENPKDFIGKTISFNRKSFKCDKGFLFLDYPCRLHHYEYKDYRPDPHEVNKGIMLWGSDDGLPRREKLFLACYSKRLGYCYYFEIDKRNELMIYYDGWMYFLRKA